MTPAKKKKVRTQPQRRGLRTQKSSDGRPLDALVPSMYETLRKVARRELKGDQARRGIDPTELLHECYVRLARMVSLQQLDRTRFLALAARVIRHVLVDWARSQEAQKRGGRMKRVTLHEGAALTGQGEIDLVHLDEALERLAALDERPARVVEMRFFGGLSNAEIARTLGVSLRTVVGDWHMARAWLRRELSRGKQ